MDLCMCICISVCMYVGVGGSALVFSLLSPREALCATQSEHINKLDLINCVSFLTCCKAKRISLL